MKFKELSRYLEKLEKEASRNKITEILAELFKKSSPTEADEIVNLVLGQLAPNFRGVVFNIADKMILQAVAKAFNVELKEVKDLYKKEGDIGNVAQLLSKGGEGRIDIEEVYQRFLKIAQDEGKGSQERKIVDTARLLSELDSLSCRFTARIPVGKLRLGFSDKTILDALSWMEHGDKSKSGILEKAYFVLPDVAMLAREVKRVGIDKACQGVSPVLGTPTKLMLAQRLKSPKEMVEKMNEVSVEPKLDGLRVAIHFKKGKEGLLKAFTRNLNEVSWMFPELKSVGGQINASEVILDTEAIGIDEERERTANFQKTMTRRRKYDIDKFAKKVPVTFYVFDILLKDKENLMSESYKKRRETLEKTIKQGKILKIVEKKITQSPEEISRLNKHFKDKGFEGILVKKADAKYIPGRTGWRWVKMKEAEDSLAKLADTLDCIVMGYSVGKGKRASFGVGQFLAGIKDGETIKTVTKVGTGLTDDEFKELKKRLTKLEVKEKPKEYETHKNYEPDYWVKPKMVVELAADEITKSPTHSSGYALRFPRLIKFRDDKNPNQATTPKELQRLFEMQKV